MRLLGPAPWVETRQQDTQPSEEVCGSIKTVGRGPGGARELELVGRNTAIQAFKDAIKVVSTDRFIDMLNQGTKHVEAAAEARKLRLASKYCVVVNVDD